MLIRITDLNPYGPNPALAWHPGAQLVVYFLVYVKRHLHSPHTCGSCRCIATGPRYASYAQVGCPSTAPSPKWPLVSRTVYHIRWILFSSLSIGILCEHLCRISAWVFLYSMQGLGLCVCVGYSGFVCLSLTGTLYISVHTEPNSLVK